jgi:hypothetical protein
MIADNQNRPGISVFRLERPRVKGSNRRCSHRRCPRTFPISPRIRMNYKELMKRINSMHPWLKHSQSKAITSSAKNPWLPPSMNVSRWPSRFKLVGRRRSLVLGMVRRFSIFEYHANEAVLRYSPYNRAVKQVIDSGALGEIINIQVRPNLPRDFSGCLLTGSTLSQSGTNISPTPSSEETGTKNPRHPSA